MNTAKVIRTIGYFVYTMLWIPVILIIMLIGPIGVTIMCIKSEIPVINGLKWYGELIEQGIAHDMNFIKTGEW